jgi:hypothetical protein
MNHQWKGRIYMANGSVKTVCTDCSAVRDAQNRNRACRSPAPGDAIWSMLTAVENIGPSPQASEEGAP